MKLNLTFTVLLAICFVSCQTDQTESLLKPSANLIELEAEGGQVEVTINSEHWHIAEVRNQDGDVRIQGDTYGFDGSLISQNAPLSLESQGKLEARWTMKGFVIRRDTPSSLNISLKENSSHEPFSFFIILQSNEQRQEIQVKQKVSRGYSFERIDFSLNQDDGDSLYVKKGTTYRFTQVYPQTFEFSPYGGIDVHKHSSFISDQNDAFVWLENDSIMVEAPGAIFDDKLVFNGDKSLYSKSPSINSHGFENMESVSLPAGESSFFVEQQWRERKLSYSLYLKNNRTGEEKVIQGKWFEVAPTGGYEVIWED